MTVLVLQSNWLIESTNHYRLYTSWNLPSEIYPFEINVVKGVPGMDVLINMAVGHECVLREEKSVLYWYRIRIANRAADCDQFQLCKFKTQVRRGIYNPFNWIIRFDSDADLCGHIDYIRERTYHAMLCYTSYQHRPFCWWYFYTAFVSWFDSSNAGFPWELLSDNMIVSDIIPWASVGVLKVFLENRAS